MKRILFVCHGNICRSPMAELVLRDLARRAGRGDVAVASAATSDEELGNPVYPPARRVLAEHGIDPRAVRQIASIDVKADEPGLLAFAEELGVPVQFFSAEQLQEAPGVFSASAFVQNAVGVDNVCERAAVLSAGEGAKLVVHKTAENGVTIAIAQENRRIRFE